MSSDIILPERLKPLNDRRVKSGEYVLYWMQQSQRAEYNHALEYAIDEANRLGLPLLVVFGLMDDYPEANARHYAFMLEGLRETQVSLASRGIKLAVQRGSPPEIALQNSSKAALIVCDRGYMRHQKAWRVQVAEEASCSVVQVESDVVVPVETVSNKAEYAARTLRPKINRHVARFLVELKPVRVKHASLELRTKSLDLGDLEKILRELKLDQSVAPVAAFFRGGTSVARSRFDQFIAADLKRYQENRNQPGTNHVSHMSPYLHFGQISSLFLALKARQGMPPGDENTQTFLDELIVRRELSMNFVEYTADYDAYTCVPQWARTTLKAHQSDRRDHTYTRSELENCQTHDEYWNAAMTELKVSGYMHNHMRMYWGKKILEWSPTPEAAYTIVLAIMNKYFLDGRDPNSYANVAWLFGTHDRPWFERPVFGTVRYMAASGLERKAHPAAYLDKVAKITARAEEAIGSS
jgi:deoxyribodipyrimidine photo-lyase